MKVKRLTINSFRKIRNLTVDFEPNQPIVFIGINGVGKSSILDCLAILLCQFTDRVLNALEDREERQTTARIRIAGISRGVKLSRRLRRQDITNDSQGTRNEIVVKTNSGEISWTVYRGQNFPTTRYNVEELRHFYEELISNLKNTSEVNLPIVVYYSINRGIFDSVNFYERSSLASRSNLQRVFLAKQAISYVDALTEQKFNFNLFFDWFKNREDLENEVRVENPDHRDPQLEAIRRAIAALPPGFNNLHIQRSDTQLSLFSETAPRLGRTPRMVVMKQGTELDINQLSDGEKGLLALVGDLARRLAIANPGLADPLQGEGIVLIDEIELHLHPKWQRWIISGLQETFPNCQFILTTHSPQIISQVKGSVYGLKEISPGEITIKKIDAYGKDSNRILEDIMEDSERPYDIKEHLLELFRLIDRGDLDRARQLRRRLADEIGADEPEFTRADVLIRRREILNR